MEMYNNEDNDNILKHSHEDAEGLSTNLKAYKTKAFE